MDSKQPLAAVAKQSGAARRLLPSIAVVVGVLSAVAVYAGLSWIMFGSPFAFNAIVRGRVLLAEPNVLEAGALRVGDRAEVKFSITNLDTTSITILGIRSHCTCISNNQTPFILKPREKKVLTLNIRPKEDQAGQEYEQVVDIYPDIAGVRAQVKVRGRVLEVPGVGLSASD